jgi:hypothetical protein
MNLSGDQIKNSYGALLNIGASGATGTLQPVTDGFGNVLPFEVSTTTFNFTGAVTGGPIGPTGAAGSSGTSGTSGVSGSSGTSGVNGSSGTSGANGSSGSSGTSGVSGSSGTSGVSGSSGTSGIDGSSGTSGVNGSSGTSGVSGSNGSSGTSGANGSSGTSGIDGSSGTSGVSGSTGSSGSSGTSGVSGSSGTSGIDGSSGTSGVNGSSGTSGVNGSSGTSGTSGVSGSSGTSGVSGSSGTSGVNGATGEVGPTGAAAPGGTAAITVEQTSSLVSTGIGATAQTGANYNILLGSCISTINPITNTIALSTRAGGAVPNSNNSFLVSVADNSQWGSGNNNIVIATNSNTFSNGSSSVNIGGSNYNNGGVHHVQIGQDLANQGGNRSILIGKGNTNQSAFDDYTGIGTCNCLKESQVQAFGNYNTIHLGATGTTVIGNSSNGGTGACDSVVIGKNNAVTVPSGIAIGANLSTCDSCTNNDAILIGRNICLGSNTGSTIAIGTHVCPLPMTGCDVIMIGKVSTSQNPNRSIFIGSCIDGAAQLSVYIGAGGQNFDGCKLIQIGTDHSLGVARESIAIGQSNSFSGGFPGNLKMLAIGGSNSIQEYCTQAYGYNNTAGCGSTGGVILGNGNTNCFANAVVIGNNLTSCYANTVHTPNLVAFGQGASLLNSIASGATAATIDWNDGNNQKIDLTSSITSLTLSNPIEGANYMLEIVQGGVGSYTITWPASIKWMNASAPTLSTTVGNIDVVSFFYDGTNYLGTFALNFA